MVEDIRRARPTGGHVIGEPPGEGAWQQRAPGPSLGNDWLGCVKAAAVAAMVGQLRRSVEERAGAVQSLQRQCESGAKGVCRSAGLAVWQGNPGCRVVSVNHLLYDVDVGQGVIAPAGFGFRLGRRERKPQTPQPGLGTKRDQSHRPLQPLAGAINSCQRTGAQQPGGISPQPLNAVRRKKDLNTPAAGLTGNEGLEHPVHRPALLAESYVKSAAAAHSLMSDITSSPDLREKPQVSTAGNLENPDNTNIVGFPDAPG